MLSFIKKRKFVIIAVIAVAIIAVIAIRAGAKTDYTSATPVVGDLVRTVKVSGKVIPREDVDLGFEIAGTVARTYKQVGDSVSRGAVIAELDRSALLADLASARAELAKLSGAAGYETKTENAKRAAVQAINDAYTEADDAVHNKTDQFFKDPRSANPEIVFAFDGFELRDSINRQKLVVEETLASMKTLASGITIASYSDASLSKAKDYLATVSGFLGDVALAVNDFEPTNNISQTTIDKYRSDVATARQNVNSAISSLISAGDKLRESVSDVPVQVAKVNLAESRLSKAMLISPISGVVSKQDAKAGEAVSVGASLVSVISTDYEIETFVPEVSIAGVKVGNDAAVTLDAYGPAVKFKVSVTHIDPAETVRDGVSTYRVKLAFSEPDPRIRSGMTANTEVETLRKPGSMLIPLRAVVKSGDDASVHVLIADEESEKRAVTLGEKDSAGNVEVLSGVSASDRILINPPQK